VGRRETGEGRKKEWEAKICVCVCVCVCVEGGGEENAQVDHGCLLDIPVVDMTQIPQHRIPHMGILNTRAYKTC
jgi:hypothetical protein